ncbi:gamma-interferon-inducible lysosomal thiol reductase-like [Rhopilema esculentum]|uniref:gamma-interferon-inducible lysosomal thiol reductase-like n=1 Tax=Rhopilema esculentum TaxID=499914 RepID=UPI0031DA38A1
MVAARTVQFTLIAVLTIGFFVYCIQYFQQNVSPQVPADCHDVERWCQGPDIAALCGVLEYCQLKWKKASSYHNATPSIQSKLPAPVDVAVYFESLCPDSIKFIIEQLYPTYQKLYGKHIFKVDLVPYGNVKETKKGDHWQFSCQHGEEECLGNIIETCAIHELQNETQWMPFILCMEKNKATLPAAKKCSEEQHFDFDIIEKCRTGTLGNQLQHEMGVKTNSLKPKHTFIPWITINGRSKGIQTKALYNFFELICESYEGPKPDACLK